MTIGIIGYGNIGSLIAEKLSKFYKVLVFDKDKDKLQNAITKKISVAPSNVELTKNSQLIIIAVKPQDFDILLDEIAGSVVDKIVVSIAAGISLSSIQKKLKDARIIRVMPNLAIKASKGMIFISVGKKVKIKDLVFVKKLFQKFGKVLCIEEKFMDAATAIGGSGPGFIYDFAEGKTKNEIRQYLEKVFIPQAKDTAISLGFSKRRATIIAKTTAEGSLKLLLVSNLSPFDLKKQVASKGGTTEAGLAILHNGGSLKEAFLAAYERAKQLSK
ncbi:MAG: NAD(P)-binding domain-containing protein [Candidatus Omnitrophica bacterium]|nr:NAD(P)-binding domain-containing protein [Candidatus Omnitrophota bacterium]